MGGSPMRITGGPPVFTVTVNKETWHGHPVCRQDMLLSFRQDILTTLGWSVVG